jgi:hypothetical protein
MECGGSTPLFFFALPNGPAVLGPAAVQRKKRKKAVWRKRPVKKIATGCAVSSPTPAKRRRSCHGVRRLDAAFFLCPSEWAGRTGARGGAKKEKKESGVEPPHSKESACPKKNLSRLVSRGYL